ncbi:MAG: hypothetical protein K2J06_06060 [Muribaculaceae bacterium]|nr:hypothetical protein [Muribaculaceae bacterium]
MAKDSEAVKEAKKRKCTPEQLTAWRYFTTPDKDGCTTKWNRVSDEEYDALVQNQLAKNGLLTTARALKKLGLEPEDVAEFEPIRMDDFTSMNTADNLYKRGADGVFRTSSYQVTWILCSKDEVYVYQCTFSLIEDDKIDKGEEYFFKDVTNFSTTEVSDEVTVKEFEGGGCGKEPKEVMKKYKLEKTKFRITVPGDKVECAMALNEETQANIRRLKVLLREKKNA